MPPGDQVASLQQPRAIRHVSNPDFEVDDGDEIDDSNVALHTARAGVNFPF